MRLGWAGPEDKVLQDAQIVVLRVDVAEVQTADQEQRRRVLARQSQHIRPRHPRIRFPQLRNLTRKIFTLQRNSEANLFIHLL